MSDKHNKKSSLGSTFPRFERDGFKTTPQRSKLMGKIKGKNTYPELLLRKKLWALGIRYSIHADDLPGKPDIIIKKYRLVVFIDGDFWHGYRWEEKKKTLKTNRLFWILKIERTKQRDLFNNAALEDLGYTVMRFWEHDLKKNLSKCVNQIMLYIECAKTSLPIDYFKL